MSLRRMDLNLLVVLDTLMAEQNVTQAAQKLGLSQSAVSHALRRLRVQFGDPLLVRGGKGMELTWRAGHIRDMLRTALRGLEAIVEDDVDFDPAQSTRLFRLCVSDYVSDHLLAHVCGILRDRAPGVRLQVNHFSGASPVLDNEIHVRLASDIAEADELQRERVLDDMFSVLMRKTHPQATAPMTLDLYLQLAHLKVSASAVGGNMIDDALARRGLARHVVVQLPSWVPVGPIVQATDLVAAIPRHWAANPAFRRQYRSHLLPIAEVRLAIDVIWSRRFNSDPGHRWLREMIIDVMRRHSLGSQVKSGSHAR